MTDTPNAPVEPADPVAFTTSLLEQWTTPDGPVALCLTQRLEPVQGKAGIVYPPTYANIGYNIDALPGGALVALLDSVGSQANRMEPIFKQPVGNDIQHLVPQITIKLKSERRSLLDLAHRAADAVVQSCPTLRKPFDDAFEALRIGNAWPLCALAPTSLVFGVWDSRGASGEKRPRLVRSVIRAWDVAELHAAAQYNSVWKALDEGQRGELEKEAKKKDKTDLAKAGFKDAPAVFRKSKDNTKKERVLGGVLVNDRIEREVTVNLVALRNLFGANKEKQDRTMELRQYLLALTLLASTGPPESFLREGCLLTCPDMEDRWRIVPRRGQSYCVVFGKEERGVIETFALQAAQKFHPWELHNTEHEFDLAEAKKLLVKKGEAEDQE